MPRSTCSRAQVPGEIVLGQIESGDDRLRVLDVRGASAVGIERGQMLPLTTVSSASGRGPDSTVLEGAGGSTTSTPRT